MSTVSSFDEIRALIQSGHPSEALAKVRELEEAGANSPEVHYIKGCCFAALGRISEARVIVRHLKEIGQVALAQRLAESITIEEPPQGLIVDEPRTAPTEPTAPKRGAPSPAVKVTAIAVVALVCVFVGMLLSEPMYGVVFAAKGKGSTTLVAPVHVPPIAEQATAQEPAVHQDSPAAAQLTGHWVSVDFVREVAQFKPGMQLFPGSMFLKELSCFADGTCSLPVQWKKGWITDNESQIRAEYFVKDLEGSTYLFLPWISGDVTIRGEKPQFYVLRKTSETVAQGPRTANAQQQPAEAQTAQQLAAQPPAIQWTQASPDITGYWHSVDFVRDPSQFTPGSRVWQGDLFLKDLQCAADGSSSMQMTWGGGWITDINSQYKAQYEVWTANGNTYLFLPWISGDVTIRGQ
ncbi:MAG: tetratricopeptide repeat protein, partial [Candidatus Hydrogenedentes bacterium]|nr:tetratricopeptide repeat protein [Candidatus Hydrogenedentota bacterium]